MARRGPDTGRVTSPAEPSETESTFRIGKSLLSYHVGLVFFRLRVIYSTGKQGSMSIVSTMGRHPPGGQEERMEEYHLSLS